jgi:hypothetical protein
MDTFEPVSYPVQHKEDVLDVVPLIILVFVSYVLLMICFLQTTKGGLMPQVTARH